MTLTAGTPRPKVPHIKGERVIVIRFINREPDNGLAGWIVSITDEQITISASQDDDGRDDYDRSIHMRASFLIADVSIVRVA